jgi:archaellum component FlaC
MNNLNTQSDIPTIQQSLHYISARLDEVTGNAMGMSNIHIVSENDYSEDIASELSTLNQSVKEMNSTLNNLSNRMEDLEFNLRPLSSIAENLEMIMMAYVESVNRK